MKRYCYVLALSLLCITSCNDWLEVNPRSETKEEDMYATEYGFKSVLTGVYISLAETELYGQNASMYIPELLAQHWKLPTEKTDIVYLMSEFDYENTSVKNLFERLWKNYYSCIAHLNSLLSNLEKSDIEFLYGNDLLLKGEALGLRGFLHLELLRFWGPIPNAQAKNKLAIPYQEEITTDPAKLQVLTYDEVCKRIIRDLDAAENLLKSVDPILSGSNAELNSPSSTWDTKPEDDWQFYRQVRFNYYAVKAAKARYYNWIGNSEKAIDNARVVIEAKNSDAASSSKFPLVTEANFSDLVMKAEHVFGVHNSQHQTYMEKLFQVEAASLTQDQASIDLAYESSIHPDDIRNKANRFWEYVLYDFSQKNHFRKYTGSSQYDALDVIPVLRVAEMYLILIENLSISDALPYIQTYRIARNMDKSFETGFETHQDVLDCLEKEYRKEFYGEGQMWFFYKKHNYTAFDWPTVKEIPEGVYVLPIPESQDMFEL